MPRGPQGGRRSRPSPTNKRLTFLQDSVSVMAWPSRGGVIVLQCATALDFDFLGLDTVHTPTHRNPDQNAEDSLCKRLLLLGAKWFDSYERYGFIANVEEDHDPTILALEAGEAEPPTTMERRWVSIGHTNTNGDGGLWVAEYDTVMYGMKEKHSLLPADAGKVVIARTMAEKCQILESMGGKFYGSLEEYGGASCLNAWKSKTGGEIGILVQTKYEEDAEDE